MATASVSASAKRRTVAAAPSWVPWVTLALAFVGLGISIYLTITHFDPKTLSCPVSGFDCQLVTTSWESRFLGIPVPFLGLFQYVVMVALCTPWAWRSARREVHLARLAFAVVGMGFVLWLVSAEFLLIKSICLWCTGVHIVTFVLFLCIVSTVPTMLGWNER